jgi:arginine/ornithine transport system permease protein
MLDFAGYGPELLKGAWLTLEVAFLSLSLALVLGLLGAIAKLSRRPLWKGLATLYTTIIRGVPDLVMMFIIFFGGQQALNMFFDWLYREFEIDYFINVNEFVAGVITIGFIYGAYMAETFRGAFLAVDNGQIEAGRAYGMSRRQIFMHISFPQMMRHALPGLGNNWQVLLKTTALVSVIGLTDMVRVATEASKAEHAPFKFFIPVVAVYLLLTWFSELIIKKLDAKYSVGVLKH